MRQCCKLLSIFAITEGCFDDRFELLFNYGVSHLGFRFELMIIFTVMCDV